jgi:ribose-phosphate pyrophosphokinase
MSDAVLFALGSSRGFGERVAAALGVALSPHEEREFDDGEHKARPLVNVRGRDAFVVHSLHGAPGESPNDKLCRLLFFAGALRDAAAGSVTAVMPYLCYARKDRKTKARDPVTTRYVAAILEAVGVDRVLTMDVHNLAAYQNAFRCGAEHLEARPVLVEHLARRLAAAELSVVSPDVGGVKRAARLRETLERALDRPVASAVVEKARSEGVVSGGALVGDVDGRVVILVDDLIGTGTTLVRAATACHAGGATAVHAVATHGLFVGDAPSALAEEATDSLVVTDTVPPTRLGEGPARDKTTVLDVAPLFAKAISRIRSGGSLVDLAGP